MRVRRRDSDKVSNLSTYTTALIGGAVIGAGVYLWDRNRRRRRSIQQQADHIKELERFAQEAQNAIDSFERFPLS